MMVRHGDSHLPGPDQEESTILLATVDTLPEPYQVLGLVEASVTGPADASPTSRLLDLLEEEAIRMGADGVIGIRLSLVTVPGASQGRLVGRVVDHFGTVAGAVLGTAIRRLSASDHGDARHPGRGHPR